MKPTNVSRRKFLTTTVAAGAAAAVAPSAAKAKTPAPVASYAGYLTYTEPTEEKFDATEKDIEGPFFREGAPLRDDLREKGTKGDTLVITGTVVARNGRPLAGVVLDVWQCNADGRYDNDDPNNPPKADQFTLRGKVKTNDKGEYTFRTIKPVPYGIGEGKFRPAHIHLKAGLDGYTPLTTQIYFKGDKYNATDPWYSKKREIDPQADAKKVLRGTFKVVLARA
jgi:catechol 1,2-dioxygenase